MDKFYVYRPLLDLLGKTEGTAKGDGYNETLAYGKMLDGKVTKGKGKDVNLVSMTLAEIDKLQSDMLKDPDNKWNSSAIGMYQIVRTTRRAIQKTLGLASSEPFDEVMQDRMGAYLLGVRGIDKYLAGRLKEDTLIDNLAKEWASLPTTAGKGYYGGQHAAVTPAEVRKVLAEVRRRHAEGQPTIIVDKEVMPPKVEKEVRQKSGWLSGIIGTIFGSLSGGGWLAGMDKDVVMLLLGAGLVFIIVMLVGGEWIVRRLRTIGKELNG